MSIAIALSGGADSLMSMLLLRESGVKVMAVHALFLPQKNQALIQSLIQICQQLDLPLHIIDLRQEFEQLVIAPFIAAYAQGLTPNPCATCNPVIKFGLLLDKVLALGAEAMATGHYARLQDSPDGPCLFRGQDPAKDQSYFLSRVPRQSFKHILFPLADWTKTQVHAALATQNLAACVQQESQEICFIPGNYRDFMSGRNTSLSGSGPIVLSDGTQVGQHQGLWNYTLGQRKGLGIAYSEPLYVLSKDMQNNHLVVGTKAQAVSTQCQTAPPNILIPQEQWPKQTVVQTIYRQQPVSALVQTHTKGMTIVFDQPRPLPAPGQIAAVYAKTGQVLAGAVLTSGENDAT